MKATPVRVKEDFITLPSVVLDGFDEHPQFDELYGKECYPYPLAALKGDRHSVTQKYLAVHVENEFLELICFPHFGGRIYSCRDKISGHDIFHPVARVSIAFTPAESGGTYSGCGYEISFPTHHSLTNIRKREYQVLHNSDGSVTVVMGELELRMRMRWEVHLTLRPGVARLEQEIRVHNRTAMYGRGRYWGNASMPQTPDLEVRYPETTAYEHGIEFGVASWPYYDGVDMNYPSNVPAPIGLEMKDVRNGYYAYYDHKKEFGMVHWAPPDETPAKKYWTWGNSTHTQHRAEKFADGNPYLELQSGRVEDQEEYEMYPPFCLKRWREVWYPIRDIGAVDAAGPDVALSCSADRDGVKVSLLAAVGHSRAELIILNKVGKEVGRRRIKLTAGRVCNHRLKYAGAKDEFRVMVLSGEKKLTEFFKSGSKPHDLGIDRASTLPSSEVPVTADDHMKAYNRDLDYFRQKWTDFEAALQKILNVDPNHAVAHRWMGIWQTHRRLFDTAEKHLDTALERCAHDGEAHFYKGLCRLGEGDIVEAEWCFKMAFRHNEEDRGAFMLGVLALRRMDFDEALYRFNACIDANGNNLRARLYYALALGKCGRKTEAMEQIAQVNRRMPNEALATVTQTLVSHNTLKGFLTTVAGKKLAKQLRKDTQTWLELVCDIMTVGMDKEAVQLADEALKECKKSPAVCLINLYRGYLFDRSGESAKAQKAIARALGGDHAFAFTFRDEEETVIDCAQRYFPKNGIVRHYRALLRGKQARYQEAYTEWQAAVRLGMKDTVVYRALATIAKKINNDDSTAERSLDKAIRLAPDDIVIREQLIGLANARGNEKKVKKLLTYPGLLKTKLAINIVNRLIAAGDYEEAVETITRKVRFPNGCQDHHGTYQIALDSRAHDQILRGDFKGAEEDLRRAFLNPKNLGNGSRVQKALARSSYLLGLALRGQNREAEAREVWEEALGEQNMQFWLGAGLWGYGLWVDRYWQGRMLIELGRKAEAQAYFDGILSFAMNKSRFMASNQRRELYTLARMGTVEAPLHSLSSDASYLEME